MPDDFAVVYEEMAGEIVVGGVFLRLLIKQPTWSFRRPKDFLVAILVFLHVISFAFANNI